MKYGHTVKFNGILYPAGEEVPVEEKADEKVPEVVTPPEEQNENDGDVTPPAGEEKVTPPAEKKADKPKK